MVDGAGAGQPSASRPDPEDLPERLAALGAAWRSDEIDFAALTIALADAMAGRSVILQIEPGVAGPRREAVRTFLEQVVRVSGRLDEARQEAAIAKLAEVLLPDELASVRGTLAADDLALRDRFIAKTSPLTSTEVAAMAGHSNANPYATAARWRKAGDILSVNHRGIEYFPTFQFRDGRPHPTVKRALAALPKNLSPWQRAFWFVSVNGWLADRTPADSLDEADAVIAAAKREAQEVMG